MFDFDVGKLVVIGAVALVVIGPKDLPRVLRQVGNAVGKMRRMATEFQGQFMEAMREADVADVKKEVEKAAEAVKFDSGFDPLKDVKDQLNTVGSSVTAALEDAPALEGPAPHPEETHVAAFEDAASSPHPEEPHSGVSQDAQAETHPADTSQEARVVDMASDDLTLAPPTPSPKPVPAGSKTA